MRSTKPLRIKKTRGEWEFLEKNKYRNLDTFLRSEVNKLIIDFNKCPDCICKGNGNMTEKRPRIHREQYAEIEKIAKKMKVSPSRVIDRLIIQPMLLPS